MLTILTLSWAAALATAVAPAEPVLHIGDIDLVVTDIYSDQELASTSGFLCFLRRSMNSIHTKTHHYVLRRELLFRPGESLRPALLDETARNLRELGFLNNVSIVPVDTLRDGAVDLRVHVQETWSLKTNFAYSRASEGSQRWNVFFSDDNFLGHGLQVGLGFGEDENSRFTRFAFKKRRLLAKRLRLSLSTTNRGDGYAESIAIDLPFHAQDDLWGFNLQAWREEGENRYYLSHAGPLGLDPATNESLYGLISRREEGFLCQLLKRVSPAGKGRVWRVGAGLEIRFLDYRLFGRQLQLSDDRFVDGGPLARSDPALAREEGRRIFPHLIVESASRHWETSSYLLQYGPLEDIPLDPGFQLKLGLASPTLGSASSQGDQVRIEFDFHQWVRLGDGYLLLSGQGEGAAGNSVNRYGAASVVAGWMQQLNGGAHRRLSRLFAEAVWADRILGSRAYVLGLNRGIRTLGFDGMAGDRLVRWNAEHGLVLPAELLGFYRVGLAAFYAGGLAWWRGEDKGVQDLRHEIGVGLRLGSTRSARGEAARLDLTWPVREGGGPVFTAVTRGLF